MPANRSRYLSVRVKTPLQVAFALALTFAVIGAVAQWLLQSQQDTAIAAAAQREVRQLSGSLGASAARLQQLGEFLPAVAGLSRGIEQANPALLRDALARAGRELEFGPHVELLQIYDPRGNLVAERTVAWGQRDRAPWWLAHEITATLEQERARAVLACTPRCMQYALVPLLAGTRTAVAVLGQPVAPALAEFARVTGVDVALLTPALSSVDPANPYVRYLLDLEAVSNAEAMEPVLLHALAARLVEDGGAGRATVRTAGRHYEVRTVPASDAVAYGRGLFVLMRDDTAAAAGMLHARRVTWLVALLSVAAATLALTAASWRNVARVQRVSRLLPMLGERRYEDVRAEIGAGPRRWLADEFDRVDDGLVQLAGRLEGLDARVAKDTAQLNERMDDLARERDLITTLFDAAPAAILTLDGALRGITANHLTHELLGTDAQRLAGRDFIEMFPPRAADAATVREALDALAQAGRGRYEYEDTFRTDTGQVHHFIWLHTALPRGPSGAAVLSTAIDVTQQRQAQHRIEWLSDHDALTGLLGREHFHAACAQHMHDVTSGAVLVLDVDHFKYVNERSGHRAGDRVLRDLAGMFSGALPPGAVAGRVGGNEFAALVPGLDLRQAQALAARLVDQARHVGASEDGHTHRITASCGIALHPEHGQVFEDLLANAEAALAEARQGGPGQWLAFSTSVLARERLRAAGATLARLRRAMEGDGLVLHFQPIVDLQSGQVARHEALVRMLGEDGMTLVSPGEFIPVAERHGLITQLDQWVIGAAIEALRRASPDAALSVNLSGPSLRDAALPLWVQAALGRAGVAAQRLVFEVTETAAVQDMAVASEVMDRLCAAGCRFALDDFGAGFSSLSYLRELPVDFVKIDGAFVRDIAARPRDQFMVKAINDVAHGLGKQTIAEFVDRPETLEFIRRTGVDYAQGFYLGRPQARLDAPAQPVAAPHAAPQH